MMQFNPTELSYRSMRYPVYSDGGMVASSSPQASAAGLAALRGGGNAVDAAVAAATALTVTEPTSNGIGSDAFALVWIEKDQKLYGLNASGWSPRALSIDAVRTRYPGTDKMPARGWTPTMVPGAPKAWASLNRRFGDISLKQVMEPAIAYARDGYPVSPVLAGMWARAYEIYSQSCTGDEYKEWFRVFAPQGRAPRVGERICLPDHARTLAAIAASEAEAFYRGELMERIVADSRANGGFFCEEDFSDYDVSWVEPISVRYRGYDICEIPPNGQGIVALMALNVLKEFSFSQKENEVTFHRQWEAMKIAFSDGLCHVTDPARMSVSCEDLLAPSYGALRAREIGETAGSPAAQEPPKGGTVYLCTADGEGNMVSYIQSNYMGFGSGIVAAGTGISLQNRGHDFSLDSTHSNCLMPRKKTYHTIIPGFILKNGRAVGPFGVMGGYMQPQGHLQVVMNLLDFGLNPQQALDAPRWQWTRGKRFVVEDTFDRAILEQLAARGHEVEVAADRSTFGRGQIIIRLENGTLVGGTEGRTDSSIACY